MKNLLNVLIVPVFLFCSFQKESGLAQKGYLKAGNAVQKGDRIMYLFFKADKDPSGREKIVLQDSKILEGRLKLLPSFDRDEMQKEILSSLFRKQEEKKSPDNSLKILYSLNWKCMKRRSLQTESLASRC